MKTFKDLVFAPHKVLDGVAARMDFQNNYGVSVVKADHSYGGPSGFYELAVMKNGELCFETPVTDDVLGYLTEEEVTLHMESVQSLAKDEDAV